MKISNTHNIHLFGGVGKDVVAFAIILQKLQMVVILWPFCRSFFGVFVVFACLVQKLQKILCFLVVFAIIFQKLQTDVISCM